MELQSRKMRVVLGGNQRNAKIDVYDAFERSASRKAGDRSTDESFSGDQGFDHGRVMEFSSKEKDQAVQAASTRRRGWHLANATGRYRSRSRISEMHRVLPL